MYDEAADFIEHEAQVEAAYQLLAHCNYVPPTAHHVLDLGGGAGMHAGLLSQRFGKVFCADIINYTSIYGGEFNKLLAEKHTRNDRAITLEKIAFVETDAMNLLFRENLFDACMSFNAFEHIPDPAKALAEIVRVLKPGGVAYISFDPIWTCDTGGHFFHRVPEPWGHLILEKADYHERMANNGASAAEIHEFDVAMNRWREFQFHKSFNDMHASRKAKILHHDSYSGTANEKHVAHPNFALARKKGFAEHELLLRQLRWVIKKAG